MDQNQKTAVVLLNLGGPDSLKAVRPFLFNLFSDPDIFAFPLGRLGQTILAWIISRRRAPEARKNYAAIGGKSPLLEYTQEQAIALQLALAEEETLSAQCDVFVCMRYWHPMSREVVGKLKESGYEKVVLLPLYPQYSGTTTGSSFNAFQRECDRQQYQPEIIHIREWYDRPKYLRAIADAIRSAAEGFQDAAPEKITLLFSAHGLPQKLVEAGDPYQQHIEATVAGVNQLLNWPDTTLCYQSRVGPLEWLRPYTDDVIRAKAAAGCRQMLVYPIAFVSDHVETLFELGQEYAEVAKTAGISAYHVVPALNDDEGLIETLKDLVVEAITHT